MMFYPHLPKLTIHEYTKKMKLKFGQKKSVLVSIENHNINLPFGQPNLASHLSFTHWQ